MNNINLSEHNQNKAEGTNKHKTIPSWYPNNSDSNKTEGKELLFV